MTSNSPDECASMYDLPNEILILIFENLKIKDLIRCSLVCRRFKLLCQEAKVPELIIIDLKISENIKDYWFYTNQQFNIQDAISVTTFNSYRSIFRLDQFRRLHFEGSQSEYVRLNVNDITQLEQLKIFVYDESDVRHEIHINLQNLKILEVDTYSHEFFITTPKLEMLKCRDFDVIHLTFPNTIKHLETDEYTESFHGLKNVEFILILQIRDFNWEKTLSDLPKLTVLSCNGSIGMELTSIKHLVDYKSNHQRSEPKIYFQSVELDDSTKIDEYRSHRDNFLFQINNYNSLAETVISTSVDNGINYNQLMDSMNDKVPDNFFKKYFSARSVHVKENVENQEHLFGFLKKFDYLTNLSLRSDSLDQSFYNRIGEFAQLSSLAVEGSSVSPYTSSKLTFNLDFLLKLELLTHFHTNFNCPNIFDLALELFTHLKYFMDMTFYFEGKSVLINLDRTSNVYKFNYDRYTRSQLDFTELVREVDAIRSRHINQE